MVEEPRALFDDEHAGPCARERPELLRHRPPAGAGADDDDVVFTLIDHGSTQSMGASGTVAAVLPLASQPAAVAP